nr:hypothetical protein CFP56_45233 [Quercus suber]
MTSLCKCPPVIDILEELKPNTSSEKFINIGMLRSLVQIWGGVRNITASLGDSEGSVTSVTSGLRESEGHIYIYQEKTPYK